MLQKYIYERLPKEAMEKGIVEEIILAAEKCVPECSHKSNHNHPV